MVNSEIKHKEVKKFDLLAVAFAILITFVYAYPVYRVSAPYFTGFQTFTESDQMAYNALAVTLKHQLYPLVEPLTGAYAGFYPPFYYFLLAQISNVTGIAVPYIWNYAMRILFPAAFFLAMYYFTRMLFGPKRGLIAALTCSLAGTYHVIFYVLGNLPAWWNQVYDLHTVIWTPFIILYNPNAESFSLVMLIICFYFTVKCIEKPSDRRSMLLASIFGAVVFMSHMFITMFLVCTQVVFMYLTAVMEGSKKRDSWVDVAFSFLLILFWLVMMVVYQLIPIALIVATAAMLFVFSYLRSNKSSPVRSVGNVLVISAILSSFYWVQVIGQLTGNSGAAYYESIYRTVPLGVPIVPYVQHVGVFIVASLIGLYALYRKKSKHLVYFSSMLIAGLFLSNNQYFNINYQPYRFIPYSFIPISILAAVGLYYLWSRNTTSKFVAIFIAALILISAVNNLFFIKDYVMDRTDIYFQKDVYNGISWLRNNTNPNEVVSSASLPISLLIRAYAENKVVLPYPSFASQEIIYECTESSKSIMFKNTTAATRDSIIEKHDISYIFIEPGDVRDLGNSIYDFSADKNFSLAYRSNDLSIYRVLRNQTAQK